MIEDLEDLWDIRLVLAIALGFILKSLADFLKDSLKKALGKLFESVHKRVLSFRVFNSKLQSKYYEAIADKYGHIHVYFMQKHRPIPLESIYIPIETDLEWVPYRLRRSGFARQSHVIPAAEAVTRVDIDNWLLLGDPGAGKTTFLKSLITYCALSQIQEFNNHLPVFISLRRFSAKSGDHSITDYIRQELKEEFGFSFKETFLQKKFDKGELLVLLDGLDEVMEDMMDAVLRRIRRFTQESTKRHNKLVITCREQVYSKNFRLPSFQLARIADFSDEDVRSFLMKWPLYPPRKSCLQLWPELEDNPAILQICRNPLMLTILASLYSQRERFEIPDSAHDFFQEAVESLFFRRANIMTKHGIRDIKIRKKERVIAYFALSLLKRLRDVEEFNYGEFVSYCMQNSTELGIPPHKVELLVEDLRDNVGLIHEINDDQDMKFAHRLFQEFLAAKALGKIGNVPLENVYPLYEKDRNTWSQVLIFYSVYLNYKQQKKLLTNLCDSEDQRDLEVAGKILKSLEAVDAEIADQIIHKLKEKTLEKLFAA